MSMTRTTRTVLLVGTALLLLTSCAAGANDAAAQGSAGFWLGLWHGIISPVTFVVSLFNDHVGIYEVHNSGHWYDFGFMVGVSATFSGLARSGAAAGSSRSGGAPVGKRRGTE